MDEKIVEVVARAMFDADRGGALMFDIARAALEAHTAALAEAGFEIGQGWQQIETAPKDGKQIILWVCTRGSMRRGWSEICWWGKHADWGET